jgi:hypothetical protein
VALYAECLALSRQNGYARTAAVALMTLARVAHAERDLTRAQVLYEQSLAAFAPDDAFRPFVLADLGQVALDRGDHPLAAAVFRNMIDEYREAGWTIPNALEGLAALAAACGDGARAARLWGAAEIYREAHNLPLDRYERPIYERTLAIARPRFDADAFAAAWAEGRAMPLENTLAETLSEQA